MNSTVTVTIIISRKVSESHKGEVPGLTELEHGRTDTQTQACLTPKVMSLPLDHGWRWTDRINDPEQRRTNPAVRFKVTRDVAERLVKSSWGSQRAPG